MRLVLQRVSAGSVAAGDQAVGSIGKGLFVLCGISRDDCWADAEYCIRKILRSRLWQNDDGKDWDRSVVDKEYEVLIVSQFTLFGNLKKGNKPDYHEAMINEEANAFFNKIVEALRKEYKAEKIATGAFGQYMNLDVKPDGPVTLFVDSSELQLKRSTGRPPAKSPAATAES